MYNKIWKTTVLLTLSFDYFIRNLLFVLIYSFPCSSMQLLLQQELMTQINFMRQNHVYK